MLRRFPFALLPALILVGCATSSPAPEDEGPRVPVYQVGDKLPCDYEVIRIVRAERKQGVRSDVENHRAMEQALGKTGADAGADAVIVDDFSLKLPFVVVRSGQPRPSPSISRLPPYEGNAVRWIPGTCKSL